MKSIHIYTPDLTIGMSATLIKDLCWVAASLANPEQAPEVKLVSRDGQAVRCFTGNTLSVELSIQESIDPDAIFICAFWGGVQKAREESHLLSPWLQRARERNIPIAAVSNAPFFLAEAGLLKDKVATIYPPAADEFRQTYTSINLRSERAITDAGNLLCANGIASGCDMVTSLIERLYGEDIARQISHDFLLGFKRDYNIANISFDGQKFHNDEQILEAQHYLETHYAKDIKVEIIASQIGMSPRNFSRRFKKATGDTPNHYLQHIRIAMAKDLLRDHDLSIAEVAYQVGYSDLSYFSRIFSRHAGCQPHIYREEAK